MAMETWEIFKIVTETGFSTVALGVSIFAFFHKGRDKQIDELKTAAEAGEKRLAAIETRLSVVEGDMRHLPDKEATHRLEIGLAQLAGQLAAMDERLKPVSTVVSRMQEFMLEKSL
jgi:hypothetical protein